MTTTTNPHCQNCHQLRSQIRQDVAEMLVLFLGQVEKLLRRDKTTTLLKLETQTSPKEGTQPLAEDLKAEFMRDIGDQQSASNGIGMPALSKHNIQSSLNFPPKLSNNSNNRRKQLPTYLSSAVKPIRIDSLQKSPGGFDHIPAESIKIDPDGKIYFTSQEFSHENQNGGIPDALVEKAGVKSSHQYSHRSFFDKGEIGGEVSTNEERGAPELHGGEGDEGVFDASLPLENWDDGIVETQPQSDVTQSFSGLADSDYPSQIVRFAQSMISESPYDGSGSPTSPCSLSFNPQEQNDQSLFSIPTSLVTNGSQQQQPSPVYDEAGNFIIPQEVLQKLFRKYGNAGNAENGSGTTPKPKPKSITGRRRHGRGYVTLTWRLMRYAFTDDELAPGNLSGAQGRKLLDPDRVEAIRMAVCSLYGWPPQEASSRWREIRVAVNSNIRRLRHDIRKGLIMHSKRNGLSSVRFPSWMKAASAEDFMDSDVGC